MNKRVVLVSAVMLAALAVAVVGATEALRLIGRGTFGAGGSPISEADVHRSLAASGTPATSPRSTSTTSPAGSHSASPHPSNTTGGPGLQNARRSFSGNTVFASCTGSQASLGSSIPASGYSIDGSSQGPARSIWVKFKSESSEVTVTVTCAVVRRARRRTRRRRWRAQRER
jgi:hypothetical protein